MKQPKDMILIRKYEPNMGRMVRALQILLEWQPKGGGKCGEGHPDAAAASGAERERPGAVPEVAEVS